MSDSLIEARWDGPPRRIPVAEASDGDVVVSGILRSVRYSPWANGVSAEFVLADRTGRLLLRISIEPPEVVVGDRVQARGTVHAGSAGLTITDPLLIRIDH